jgi:hypothetical protein
MASNPNNAWYFPDIARIHEDGVATTSVNTGVYERPFGGMVVRAPSMQAPGYADAIATPPGEWFDADEYLRKVGLL